MTQIDYFFTLISPFAYLGHGAIQAVAARHGASLAYKPVGLMAVWENSGSMPLGKRSKARQDARLVELQRWREKRGVPLNLHPKHFPTNPTLADRCVIAITEAGGDPAAYMDAGYKAVWANDLELSDRDVIAGLLSATDHDAEAMLAAAESDHVASVHKGYTEDAINLHVIGSPCYVLNGETFWGQDKIDLLDDALASGRAPFSAEAP